MMNSKCIFKLERKVSDTHGRYRCEVCGWLTPVVPLNSRLHAFCRGESKVGQTPDCKRTPSTREKMRNYSHAVKKWYAAGRPKRTDEEVTTILKICAGSPEENIPKCILYRNGACSKCGCPVNEKQNALRNKVRMATESCPEGKW